MNLAVTVFLPFSTVIFLALMGILFDFIVIFLAFMGIFFDFMAICFIEQLNAVQSAEILQA